MNITLLTTGTNAQIASSVIAAIAVLLTIVGLIIAFFAGRWKASDRVNKGRSKARTTFFRKKKKDGCPYTDPSTYYEKANEYIDSHGRKFLADNLAFQTGDVNFETEDKIVFKHKLFWTKHYDSKLYKEDNKMAMANMKRFNSLILFIDEQVSYYLDQRNKKNQSLWNMPKWYRFMRILRAKLLKIKKELSAIPVNEITIKVPVKGSKKISKFKFRYSFIMGDYSDIHEDLVKNPNAKLINHSENDEVIKLMRDFPGIFEKEGSNQFAKIVDKALSLDLYLNLQWKQSDEVIDVADFVHRHRDLYDKGDAKKAVNEEIPDDSLQDEDMLVYRKCQAEAREKEMTNLTWTNGAERFRHLRIKSNSIKFDDNGNAYYKYDVAFERNVFMIGNGEDSKPFIEDTRRDIKMLLAQYWKDIFSPSRNSKRTKTAYQALLKARKPKTDVEYEHGYPVKQWTIDLDNKYRTDANEIDFNQHDKHIVEDLIMKLFVKVIYPNVDKINELPVYEASVPKGKSNKNYYKDPISGFRTYKPKDGEVLLNKDANDSNIAWSLDQNSHEFPASDICEEYCLDELKNVFDWKEKDRF